MNNEKIPFAEPTLTVAGTLLELTGAGRQGNSEGVTSAAAD